MGGGRKEISRVRELPANQREIAKGGRGGNFLLKEFGKNSTGPCRKEKTLKLWRKGDNPDKSYGRGKEITYQQFKKNNGGQKSKRNNRGVDVDSDLTRRKRNDFKKTPKERETKSTV